MKTTLTFRVRLISMICLPACLLNLAPAHAQYGNKSPADILREAQERQRAIDKIGEDFRREAQALLEREQQRREQER